MNRLLQPFVRNARGGRAVVRLTVAVLMAAALTACGHKDMRSQLAADNQSQLTHGQEIQVKGEMQFLEPKTVHEGIGLRSVANGNHLAIYLLNVGKTEVVIRPTDFAVIVDGKLHRVQRGQADMHLFPPVRLEPGATAMGMIGFPGLGDLAGSRLVFNNPQVGKPFFVAIEGGQKAGGISGSATPRN